MQPTRLVFGPGRFCQAGKLAREYGRRALLVTGRSAMNRLGYTQQLTEDLDEAGVSVCLFQNLDPTPSLENVDEGAEHARQHRADMIIGLGGGSAIDCAKAVAVAASGSHACAEYFYGKIDISARTLPILSIPTTAGTGSESNRAEILTDPFQKHKDALRSDYLFPRLALVDSQLTHHVPKLVTAQTGFDAFAHALESYVSPKAQPIASLLAARALRTIIKWLPIALEQPNHAVARERLLLASTSMGYNLSCVGTCLPHRLDKPLCALLPQIAHGQAIALFYPAWINACWQGSPKQFAKVTKWLNPEAGNWAVCDAAEACAHNIRQFIGRLGLAKQLSELGIDGGELDLDRMSERVRGDLRLNPVPVLREQLTDYYRRALYPDNLGVH